SSGLSVVQTLLADGTFIPRAITRNCSSEKALKLKNLGAEVAQADLWDIGSLKQALSGVETVYGVSSISSKGMTDYYLSQQRNATWQDVDADKATDVKYFIWSSLPHCTRVSNGKYANVYHFDNKANVDDYLRESGIPHSILYTGKQFFILSVFRVVQYSCACDRLELTVARHDAQTPEYFTWFERGLNQCALALLKHYKDPESEVISRTFYAFRYVIKTQEFVDSIFLLPSALGKPVSFVSSATTGIQFGLYPGTVIPGPRLINLGVKFHTTEEFSQEIKGRYA
ncbi:NAD(P)-binding protein, partial [Suillus fuscotomentosus]